MKIQMIELICCCQEDPKVVQRFCLKCSNFPQTPVQYCRDNKINCTFVNSSGESGWILYSLSIIVLLTNTEYNELKFYKK